MRVREYSSTEVYSHARSQKLRNEVITWHNNQLPSRGGEIGRHRRLKISRRKV